MPTDPADLQERLAAATPRDTVRGVIFNAGFAVIEEQAGKAAAVEWDPAGKGRRSEFFSYPVADYLRLIWRAADELADRMGGRDNVFREFGSRASLRWLSSALGRTLVAFTGNDPRRLLAYAGYGYRNVVSYGTRKLEWLDERRARLVFRRDFLVPAFHCGVIKGVLETACKMRFRVQGRETAFLESEYEITW